MVTLPGSRLLRCVPWSRCRSCPTQTVPHVAQRDFLTAPVTGAGCAKATCSTSTLPLPYFLGTRFGIIPNSPISPLRSCPCVHGSRSHTATAKKACSFLPASSVTCTTGRHARMCSGSWNKSTGVQRVPAEAHEEAHAGLDRKDRAYPMSTNVDASPVQSGDTVECDFLRPKIADQVWLSACRACRKVVAFSNEPEGLRVCESTHSCPMQRRSLDQSLVSR